MCSLWLGVSGGARAPLYEGDAVAEGQRDALGLAPDAHVAAQLPVCVALLLHAHVHERVLAEHAHGVQVRRLSEGRQASAQSAQAKGRKRASKGASGR